MAFIIKTNSEKNILVLKHLEYPFYSLMNKRVIEKIRAGYYVLIYFGYHTVKKGGDYDFVDGYIAEDNVLDIDVSNLPRLNYNGYNFISGYDDFKEKEKVWDYIFIGDPTPRKGLIDYISAIQKYSELGGEKRFLLINRVNKNNKLYRVSLRKIRRLMDRISPSFRNRITYLEIESSNQYPIPKDIIQNFYLMSSTLVLPSRGEGAARVFSEAKLCGLNAICYSGMRGGTLNHIQSNDFLFDDSKQLSEYLTRNTDISENERVNLRSRNYELFSTKYTKPKFVKELSHCFNLDESVLDDFFSKYDLYNSLSSHNRYLPREIPSNKYTDECLSYKSITSLAELLLNERVKYPIYGGLINLFVMFKKYIGIIKRKLFSE